jgi:hypothetical protein
MRVNTDADVSRFSRISAVGSFTSQLQILKSSLAGAPKNEIRVLCLHHSPSEGQSIVMGIDNASKRELNNFIVDMDVAVILTGHIHNPALVKTFTAQGTIKRRDYLEARCGTTTQVDLETNRMKAKIKKVLGIRPKGKTKTKNSLLVHRLMERGGEIFWETEVYFLQINGFERPVIYPADILVNNPVKVWP